MLVTSLCTVSKQICHVLLNLNLTKQNHITLISESLLSIQLVSKGEILFILGQQKRKKNKKSEIVP